MMTHEDCSVKSLIMKVYCKGCKYKVRCGIGCWHPKSHDDSGSEWCQEMGILKCEQFGLFRRKHWWKSQV